MTDWRNATIPDVLKRKFTTLPSSTDNKVQVRHIMTMNSKHLRYSKWKACEKFHLQI